MRLVRRRIEGYEYIHAIYKYKDDKDVLDAILEKAYKLSGKVNPHSSGGSYREENTRINKLTGGLLLEHSVTEAFKTIAERNSKIFSINTSSFEQDQSLESMGFNQIDLELDIDGKIIKVEIRFFFSYKTTVKRLFGFPLKNNRGAFSLIGWYKSANKPMEVKKDFYIFGIHFYNPKLVIEKVKSQVEVMIATGASKETLEKIGFDDNLKQSNATFRIINPIKNAPEVSIVINNILGIT
jgi:hypothetical protein